MRRYSLSPISALSIPKCWLGIWCDQGISESCSFLPLAKWIPKSSTCSETALTEYSQCPSPLYGPLVSTNFWKLEYTGSSHYKQMEDMRSHLSYTKLTPLLRCSPPLMTLDIGVGQILEPLQSSVLKWFPPLLLIHCYPVCVLPYTFWITFKIRTGISSHTFSSLRRYCLEQNQKPLIEGKTG